jgi:cell division protease FtsH
LALRGRLPPLPQGLGAGLDLTELVAALRPVGGAADAVRRLEVATRGRVASPAGAALPSLEDAVEYGAARDCGLALAAEVAAARRGEIDWANHVDRGAVLYGPPGTRKTWLARLIAVRCGLPLVEASVADLFATSSGYLDGVIKAQRALFAKVGATAPCILFLDELEAMPNRARLSPRRRDW